MKQNTAYYFRENIKKRSSALISLPHVYILQWLICFFLLCQF